MVTSSAVVGSSANRIDGSPASAMASTTRWRMPPEKVVRIQATPLLRPVDADKAHQLEHALFQSRAAQAGAWTRTAAASCAPTVMLGFSAVIGS